MTWRQRIAWHLRLWASLLDGEPLYDWRAALPDVHGRRDTERSITYHLTFGAKP